MLKQQLKFGLIAAIVTVISITGCKKDNELPNVDEEELITTLRLKFVNSGNAADVRTFSYRDLDGTGGNAPTIEQIRLAANATYVMTVDAVLNESETPAEDIKAEIVEEADEHLFVYKKTGANLTITVTDKDVNNLPIGLAANAVTGAVSTGTLQVLLRHQPGTKNGTETPGSSDIDAMFNVVIE